ncbi:MAG: hypothetical protein Q7J77_04835 [Undibacterium sp.]|nr:hypothetical protein [Undibacterium sp.]
MPDTAQVKTILISALPPRTTHAAAGGICPQTRMDSAWWRGLRR